MIKAIYKPLAKSAIFRFSSSATNVVLSNGTCLGIYTVFQKMKKSLQLLLCSLPVLLLAAFYVCRLGFHMRDAHIAGMLMILIGAVLSVLIPVFILLLRLFWSAHIPLGACFISSFVAGVVYWAVCYLDLGSEIHQFLAA
jgi:hypothetical protein